MDRIKSRILNQWFPSAEATDFKCANIVTLPDQHCTKYHYTGRMVVFIHHVTTLSPLVQQRPPNPILERIVRLCPEWPSATVDVFIP